MADKTPVRVVFNSSNVATGMAEFQSGETVAVSHGGTGLSSIGSSGQVLKVNAAGNALEFAAEGDVSITNLVAPTNADLTFTTSGTGNIVLDAITVNGTTLSAEDSSKITIAEALDVTGALTFSGLALPTSDGSTGQFLKTDGSGTLSFADLSLGDLTITGSTIATPSNADLTLSPGGTGGVVASGVTIRGTSISSADSSSINITDNVEIDGNLVVTGTLDLSDSNFSNVGALQLDSIAGDGDTNTSITFSGSDVITVATGGSTAATFNADQTTSFSAAVTVTTTTTDDSLLITTTEASNSAAPVVTLKRNSSTPANADYLGRIKFKGENDADQEVQYASISGKIIDVADGSEDGAVEFNIKKAGSNNIAARFSSTELKLLNGTTLDVDGAGTFAGVVTATSVTSNDFTSNGSNADITIAPQGTGDINLTAGADVNIPSGIGLTFATTEKIESDGTDLTITVGSNGDINIPANIGLTFGNDGEKIEGDGTDLTITGNLINLTAAAAVVLPSGIPLRFVDDNEKITSNGTDLTINSGADINLTATADVNIPANVGITFGDDAEKIEGDGTDLTITGNNIKLTAATDVIIPTNVGLHFTDANEKIESDGTNLILTSGGTDFKLPTSDGSAGEFLKTDGSGNLSFGSAAATASDDTRAVVKNNKSMGTSPRTMDYFQATSADMAWYFTALNDLENDHVSASVFTVVHDDSNAFISGPRGGASGTANTLPTTTADISSGQVRVRITAPSSDSKISFYKIPISRDNTSDATSGVTVTTSNTDVDSASESIDTFAHASFRAAKYTILVEQPSIAESGVTEALVVHDGSNAYVAQYGTVNSGNNDMITLSAAIDGSNVVLSAAGLTPNLSLKIHKTLLADSMTAVSNANQKIIAATTVSSSATAFDNFDLDDHNGALYYVVGKNATEGAFSIQEVYVTGAPGEAGVAQGAFVSTKGTSQLEFTADFKSDADNSVELSVASTSGGSTIVNAYCIKCLAE